MWLHLSRHCWVFWVNGSSPLWSWLHWPHYLRTTWTESQLWAQRSFRLRSGYNLILDPWPSSLTHGLGDILIGASVPRFGLMLRSIYPGSWSWEQCYFSPFQFCIQKTRRRRPCERFIWIQTTSGQPSGAAAAVYQGTQEEPGRSLVF